MEYYTLSICEKYKVEKKNRKKIEVSVGVALGVFMGVSRLFIGKSPVQN